MGLTAEELTMNTKNAKAIEWVIFKPNPKITVEEVRESLESLNPILKSYKGFLGRQLASGNDGQWMDLVFWETIGDAKFAADNILKNEKAGKAFGVIDETEMQFFHFEPVT